MNTVPNAGADLLRIHKVITRALNVALQNSQAGMLVENLRPGFASYVRALTILLHGHHTAEDELAFPFWKTRFPAGQYDELMMQHRQMIQYLERIEHWLGYGPEAWQAHSLEELHQALSSLQALWEAHIAQEEATVGPENSQRYLTPEENAALSRQLAEYGQAHTQPSELVMPFVIYNLPEADRSAFLKLLPPVLSQQLVPVTWKAVWEPMTPFLLIS